MGLGETTLLLHGLRRKPQALSYHPAFDGRTLYTIEPRPPGDNDEANTAQTIARMAQYAREDSQNPIVRRAAYEAIGSERNERSQAEAVHGWIRAHVRFIEDAELAQGVSSDPHQAEVLIRPVDLLTMPRPEGDCDDFSMLCAAMLRALGIRAWFKTVAAAVEDPEHYSHVYVVADVPGGPLPLDCSHGAYPGWEVQRAGKARLWPVEQPASTSGLGIIEENNVDSTDTSWWQDLISQGLDVSGDIFKARYGVPQLESGQTVRLPNCTFASQLPAGTVPAVASTANTGLLLLIVAGVAIFILASRKN